MIDILKNVSKITSIPKTQLDGVMQKVGLCVAHEVLSLVDGYDNAVELDIGIGTLRIMYVEDAISYKFIPSNQLEKMVISVAKTGESPLVDICEKTITDRILTAYKELI